jgi:hypothetical protein
MSTIVALFDEENAASWAADELLRAGVPAGALHVHRRGQPPRNASGVIVDEYATGGFFTSFRDLLDGLLETGRAPGTAASYAELVRFEGAAVSVDGKSVEVARAADVLRKAGARKVSRSAD